MSNLSEYDKQALAFLKSTNTFFSAKYNKQEDRFNSGTPTDVYTCELSNERSTYTFDFSQSIIESALYKPLQPRAIGQMEGINYQRAQSALKTIREELGELSKSTDDHLTEGQHNRLVSAVRRATGLNGKTGVPKVAKIMEAFYGLQEKKAPTEYDVLACLSVSDSEDFADFAMEFGYEMNTAEQIRNAQKTYNAVRNETRALKELFTEEQLDQLNEIA